MSVILITVVISACTSNTATNLSSSGTQTDQAKSLTATNAPTNAMIDRVQLNGGILATLQIDDNGEMIDSAEKTKFLFAYKNIISNRLEGLGILDFSVAIEASTENLKIAIPKSEKTVNRDAKKLIESLIFVSRLYFQEVKLVQKAIAGSYTCDGANYKKTGSVLLESHDFSNATSEYNVNDGNYVWLRFTDAGAAKFSTATASLATHNGFLGIFMDDDLISAPIVERQITGDAIITGKFTAQQTGDLAEKIRSGNLPFSFKLLSIEVLSR